MKIREPILAGSWYPRDSARIKEFLLPLFREYQVENNGGKKKCRAVIAPHAGWYYSGHIAARSIVALENAADTVVIIGGHLPEGAPFLFAGEDAARTPLGLMAIDDELRTLVKKELDGREDRYRDNTVEILVPIVHLLFPNARLLWVRFPGELSAFEAGEKLAMAGKALGRSLVVAGSTDLTHYGDNYGFSPYGRGKAALDWVRTSNDAAFIQAVLDNDPALALRRAYSDSSSCSVGAVLGVLGFANAAGLKKAELLEYGTSADIGNDEIPDSFVGYAAISWEG